jgi:hypothetical protein
MALSFKHVSPGESLSRKLRVAQNAKDGHLKGNAGIPGTGLSYQTY